MKEVINELVKKCLGCDEYKHVYDFNCIGPTICYECTKYIKDETPHECIMIMTRIIMELEYEIKQLNKNQ